MGSNPILAASTWCYRGGSAPAQRGDPRSTCRPGRFGAGGDKGTRAAVPRSGRAVRYRRTRRRLARGTSVPATQEDLGGKPGRPAARWLDAKGPRDVPRLGGPSCPGYVRRYGCARMPCCEESRVRTRVPLRKVIHREAVQVPSKRPRHQDKELEAVLEEAEEQGWRVDKGKGYFRTSMHVREPHEVGAPDAIRWELRQGPTRVAAALWRWKEGER